MTDADDQTQIADNLADRAARRRQELGLDTPAAQAISGDIAVEHESVTCECGAVYRASVLRGGEKVIRMPARCAACRSSGEEPESKADDGAKSLRAVQAEERAARQRAKRFADLAVPKLYADVTIESFKHHGDTAAKHVQMRVCSWARRYIAQFPEVRIFQVLQGGFGTGKGHIAWSIGRALVDLDHSVRVVKLPALVRELRDTWRKDSGRTYEQALAPYLEADLLIVDEVSRHAFYGEAIHQHLYDIIDTRIESRRPVILTTNEDDAGLMQVLRPALFNRLEGEGGAVPFGDASWRSLDDTTRAVAIPVVELVP